MGVSFLSSRLLPFSPRHVYRLPTTHRYTSGGLTQPLARMVRALGVMSNLRQRKPRRLHCASRVKTSLVEIMGRGRVCALAEDEQRAGLRLRPELDDADVGVAEETVAPLLPLFGACVEVKDDAERAGGARHRQA